MRQLSTDPPSFPACSQPGPDLTWMTETRILVLIPARMAATRLPGKPLLDIGGLPMIVHVLRQAEEAKIGRVAVATPAPEIAAAVKGGGGEGGVNPAHQAPRSHPSHEGLRAIEPARP